MKVVVDSTAGALRSHRDRLLALQEALVAAESLWRPQPFREICPAWTERWPGLAARLASLSDDECARLSDDGEAARALLADEVPAMAGLQSLVGLPAVDPAVLPDPGAFWDREIPGRKRAQIEAFAVAARPSGRPVFDWCGGKGHLARLLALVWRLPATTLEIDPALCGEGAVLAKRAGVEHDFLAANALHAEVPLPAGHHVVALHACGALHRHLLQRAVAVGVEALDVVPCCHVHGVDEVYAPLSRLADLRLSRDDLRLAVTETVTAAPRIARRSERERAWKLAFVELRRQATGEPYRTFRPVPRAWMSGDFESFCRMLAAREKFALPATLDWITLEQAGWRRLRDVMRQSIVRHAFRRPLEIWLACDMAVFLEEAGYRVRLAEFCPRRLTPRNLLLSARRAV